MMLARNGGMEGRLTGRDVSDDCYFAGYLNVTEDEASKQRCEWTFVNPLRAGDYDQPRRTITRLPRLTKD